MNRFRFSFSAGKTFFEAPYHCLKLRYEQEQTLCFCICPKTDDCCSFAFRFPVCLLERCMHIKWQRRYTMRAVVELYPTIPPRILHALSRKYGGALSCISASVHRCHDAQNKRANSCFVLLRLHKSHGKIRIMRQLDRHCPPCSAFGGENTT